MVVYGRHPEDSFATPFEREHLNDDGERLHDEYAPNDHEEELLLYHEGDCAERRAEGESPRVAHEQFRRICVVPKETDAGTEHGAAEDRELTHAFHIKDLQVLSEFHV